MFSVPKGKEVAARPDHTSYVSLIMTRSFHESCWIKCFGVWVVCRIRMSAKCRRDQRASRYDCSIRKVECLHGFPREPHWNKGMGKCMSVPMRWYLLDPRPLSLIDSLIKESISDSSFNIFLDQPNRENAESASLRNFTVHSGFNAKLISAWVRVWEWEKYRCRHELINQYTQNQTNHGRRMDSCTIHHKYPGGQWFCGSLLTCSSC